MIHIIFSIHDQKAEAYLPPFILPTEAMAKRTFQDCVNDQGHAFGKHPYDYTLFKLGLFDDHKAKFALETSPKSLGNGVEYKTENYDPNQPQLELVQE